jgi:predicted HTH transcriptional regulator
MGIGIQGITRRCLEYGLPEPEFKIRDGFVAIIHRKKGLAFEIIDTPQSPPNHRIEKKIAGCDSAKSNGNTKRICRDIGNWD